MLTFNEEHEKIVEEALVEFELSLSMYMTDKIKQKKLKQVRSALEALKRYNKTKGN